MNKLQYLRNVVCKPLIIHISVIETPSILRWWKLKLCLA